MLKNFGVVFFLTWAIALAGCSKKESSESADADKAAKGTELSDSGRKPQKARSEQPEHVVLQHILVAFEGSIPGKAIRRSRQDAEALAKTLYEQAKKGEDFDKIVREHTDDSHPGIYRLANFGVEANPNQGVFSRAQMVRGFGDVGFQLDVGEIGMAAYDLETSPYGWHIIKRIE
jgi:hypothetical protein